ncbi:ScbA/BarX family gamma-butyrolactone biosynthesis protein [Streptomyces halobius]|uniref:ScbA protein n=1 Tax=Streptomyces halobius TaxID=2879846 RepID=A0ABY4M0F3_9ACTN|nr:ScbA/BarX family gamma-butyrolactone biosynthesis protein [Streptomyces halobius]UQA90937.1 ScbA protein [Streptomyces halobius]
MSDTTHIGGTVRPGALHTGRPASVQRAVPRPRRDVGVPGEFVHRPATEDILITSWNRLDDSHFSLTARWPHDHRYFTPDRGRHNILLVGETIRQAGLLLSHTELGVPVGHHFILGDLVWTTHQEHLAVAGRPAQPTIEAALSDLRMRAGKLVSGRFDMTFRLAGNAIATGHFHVSVTAPGVYRRIRGERLAARRTDGPLPAPVPHRLTGSLKDSDVLLAPTDRSDRWVLRLAPGHAALVNPANDHVPGMVLLDAAQQAARALSAPAPFAPYAFSTEFHRYAEHDAPCVIEARRTPSSVPGTVTVRVTGHQAGETVFASTLTALERDR